MNDTDEIKNIKSTFDYGMFLHTILVMTNFSLQKNKQQVFAKMLEFQQAFLNSLTEEEKKEYDQILDQIATTKGEEFIKNLESFLSPEEVNETLSQIVPPSPPTTT